MGLLLKLLGGVGLLFGIYLAYGGIKLLPSHHVRTALQEEVYSNANEATREDIDSRHNREYSEGLAQSITPIAEGIALILLGAFFVLKGARVDNRDSAQLIAQALQRRKGE